MCLCDVATIRYGFICGTVSHHADSGFFMNFRRLVSYVMNSDNDKIESKHPRTEHCRVRGIWELLGTSDLFKHHNTLLGTSLWYFT